MNVERLTAMKAFFDAGAPHYAFNVNVGYSDLTKETESNTILKEYFDDAIPSDCGSAGCIAGLAYERSCREDGEAPEIEPGWILVRDAAMEYLDLHSKEETFFGHDLFSIYEAPKDCTAPQAAQAIQNVIEGKAPWVGVA
jgi:hypothetical protein